MAGAHALRAPDLRSSFSFVVPNQATRSNNGSRSGRGAMRRRPGASQMIRSIRETPDGRGPRAPRARPPEHPTLLLAASRCAGNGWMCCHTHHPHPYHQPLQRKSLRAKEALRLRPGVSPMHIERREALRPKSRSLTNAHCTYDALRLRPQASPMRIARVRLRMAKPHKPEQKQRPPPSRGSCMLGRLCVPIGRWTNTSRSGRGRVGSAARVVLRRRAPSAHRWGGSRRPRSPRSPGTSTSCTAPDRPRCSSVC